MEFSLPHILILLLVVILVFSGGKKIPELMKGLGQGIREFKAVNAREQKSGIDSEQPSDFLDAPSCNNRHACLF